MIASRNPESMTRQERRTRAFNRAWNVWRSKDGNRQGMNRRDRREAARDQAKMELHHDSAAKA